MENIKMIVLDLDGTLLNEDHDTVSPQNRTALEAAAACGIEIVVATGRCLSAIAPQVMELPFIRYFITGNGSVVTQRTGAPLYQKPIPADVAVPLVQRMAEKTEFIMQLYMNNETFISQRDWDVGHATQLMPHHLRALTLGEHHIVPDLAAFLVEQGGCAEKINIPNITAEQREALCEWLEEQFPGRLRAVSSLPWNIELNNAEASKGAALRALCDALAVDPAECVAFGDADNDTEMLQLAGVGVAMGNAQPALKAVAAMVTLPNSESGVAAALSCLLGLE